jgi:hypothetical protein
MPSMMTGIPRAISLKHKYLLTLTLKKRVVEGVAAVDALEVADRLFGKKALSYLVGVYLGG